MVDGQSFCDVSDRRTSKRQALGRRKENPMDPTDDQTKFRGGVSSESRRPIRLAGSVLRAQRHVCAFFRNPDEQYRILLPFIMEGFECGDRAFHVVDRKLREEHLRRLESSGIAVTATQHRHQLEVTTVEKTFLR